MRFMGGRTSSRKVETTRTEEATSSRGLLPVTTGFSGGDATRSVPTTSRGANLSSPERTNKQRHHVPNQRKQHAAKQGHGPISSFDEEILAQAFDQNGENESREPSVANTKTCPQSDIGSALDDIDQATAQLQNQIQAWDKLSVECGRAALREAKKHGGASMKVTRECKFQLLRRRLYKVHLQTAAVQLERLEQTRHALQHEQEEYEQSKQATALDDSDSDAAIRVLEHELDGVNVVQEFLSRDLAADFDEISEMDYNDEELLQELHSLSQDEGKRSRTNRRDVTTTSHANRTSNKPTLGSKKKPSGNHLQATLF